MSDPRDRETQWFCEITQNPCGSDSWPNNPGGGCRCQSCVAYRDQEIASLRARLERANNKLLELAEDMDENEDIYSLVRELESEGGGDE